jgi:hypothetical protein
VVGVWGVDVFGASVRHVFSSREEECGTWEVEDNH